MLEIGISDHEPAQINPMAFQARMISVIGNLSGSIPHYHKALRFLDRYRDRFDFSEMISNVYPLDQINEACDVLEAGEIVGRAIIEF